MFGTTFQNKYTALNDNLPARLLGGGWAVWFYLWKIFWPVHLTIIYPRWNLAAAPPAAWLPGICFTAIHLDLAARPSVVLMNPPFSVAAHVEGRVADAAFRHVTSALARLADGGRLVAITGASLAPDNPAWRESFVHLQQRGRVVFSAAIDGSVYARHGTTIDTRLTVIDRVPAGDPTAFRLRRGWHQMRPSCWHA